MTRRAAMPWMPKALAAALLAAVAAAALVPGADAGFGGGACGDGGILAKHFGGAFGCGQQQQQPQQQQQQQPQQAAPATTPTPSTGTGGGSGTGCPSIIEAARATPDLSSLVAALEAAGLATGPLADRNFVATVFAPTNAAFRKLTAALGITQAQLFNRTVRHALRWPTGDAMSLTLSFSFQQSLLQTVLKYHVVPGAALRAAQLKSEQRLTTLQGSNLTIRLEGSTVRVIGVSSRATVTAADVPACKAVVHVVDTVLLPQPLGP